MFERRYAPFVAAATLLMTLQPIITSLSKVDGQYEYVQISTTMLSELLKLLVSFAMYMSLPPEAHSHHLLKPRHLVPFAAPAAIYFVNNNLIFLILAYVNSTTYQILSSLKTVFTGLLFRAMLKRKLSDLQMLAIVLLSCGTATSQIGTSAVDCSGAAATKSSSIGVAAAVLTCLLSALGGVYSERLMKHDAKMHSIHLQNILLYAWGVVFNLFGMLGNDGLRVWKGGLLQGYTNVVWLLVLNNALNGLAISAILKYTDNIVRVFAHAAAMMVTMALELLIFGASPTPQLLISATVVACAVYIYNHTAARVPVPAAAQKEQQQQQQGEQMQAAAADADDRGSNLEDGHRSHDEGDAAAADETTGLLTLTRSADGYSIRRGFSE